MCSPARSCRTHRQTQALEPQPLGSSFWLLLLLQRIGCGDQLPRLTRAERGPHSRYTATTTRTSVCGRVQHHGHDDEMWHLLSPVWQLICFQQPGRRGVSIFCSRACVLGESISLARSCASSRPFGRRRHRSCRLETCLSPRFSSGRSCIELVWAASSVALMCSVGQVEIGAVEAHV